MIAPNLPRYQGGDIKAYLDALASDIERALVQAPQGRPYSVTNGIPTRALDVSTASASDVAKVVGALIGDLKARSVIA